MTRRGFLAAIAAAPVAAAVPVVAAAPEPVGLLALTADDLQFAAFRRYQVEEIARVFSLSPRLLASSFDEGALAA